MPHTSSDRSYIGVMSIPASVVVSKLRYPETEEIIAEDKLNLSAMEAERSEAANWIHAFTNGCWLGMKLAGIVVAVLACVFGLVELCDGILTWAGSYLNIENLTLELILTYALVPVAFFLGVPRNNDLLLVSRLIAVKILKVSLRLLVSARMRMASVALTPPTSRTNSQHMKCFKLASHIRG